MGFSVFFKIKSSKSPYRVISTRGVQILGKKRCQKLISQKNREITALRIFPFSKICVVKKKFERSLEKMVNFAQNTNFDIFPQKLNMKAHFPNFSDFLHVWCVFYNIWKLVILIVILCLGYSKIVVLNSHLKSGENWPKRKFSLKNNTPWRHIFSIFDIFTYLGCFSKHTLYVPWNHCFFLSAQICQNWKIRDAVFS